MKLGKLKEISLTLTQIEDPYAQTELYELILSMGLDPGTLYQELEMTSRFVDTHRDTSNSNTHLPLHSHAFYELLFCRNTCGAEYLVGSKRYRLQRGDLIFVPPGVSHRPLLPETLSEPYKRYVLWLSPEFMEHYASLFPYPFSDKQAHPSMLRTGGTPWEQLGDYFRKGVQEAEQQADGWEAAVMGNTITLLTMIKRATDDRSAQMLKAEKTELLDRIIVYLEKNYSKSITIGDLANEFYVSNSTVSHLFKKSWASACTVL